MKRAEQAIGRRPRARLVRARRAGPQPRPTRARMPARRPSRVRLNEPIREPKAETAAVLLSGGNPQDREGRWRRPGAGLYRRNAGLEARRREAPRRAHRADVPDVRKAVKWNSPFYGIEGQGWFLGLHIFTRYVKVAFFRGTSLTTGPARRQQEQGYALHRHPRRRRTQGGLMHNRVSSGSQVDIGEFSQRQAQTLGVLEHQLPNAFRFAPVGFVQDDHHVSDLVALVHLSHDSPS